MAGRTITWDIRTSSTRSGTLSSRRTGSTVSGKTNARTLKHRRVIQTPPSAGFFFLASVARNYLFNRRHSHGGTGFLSCPNRFCLACHSHLSNYKAFLDDDVTAGRRYTAIETFNYRYNSREERDHAKRIVRTSGDSKSCARCAISSHLRLGVGRRH